MSTIKVKCPCCHNEVVIEIEEINVQSEDIKDHETINELLKNNNIEFG